jgi:hypothetical protein
VDPAGEYVPAAQFPHTPALTAPSALDALPAGHSAQALALASDHRPPPHRTQSNLCPSAAILL